MTIDESNYQFRMELARELGLLKVALNSCSLPKKSIDSIDKAINRLKNKTDLPQTRIDPSTGKPIGSPLSWGYDVNSFVIQIDLSNNLQYPKKINNAVLDFNIKVQGEFFDYKREYKDPFNHLEFNIIIEGKSRKAKDHILSYHLDRHIEGKNPSNEVHPIYHFQMGGRKLGGYKAIGRNFGNQLIIDSPRFMHYPMDFICGLDFILSNFAPDIWRKLKRNNNYVQILKNAQERTMKPFFAVMAGHYGFHSISNHWSSKEICPQVIK